MLSQTGVWRECRVVEKGDAIHGAIKVHYEGFDSQWDEWLLPDEVVRRVRWRIKDEEFGRKLSAAPTTSSSLDAMVAKDIEHKSSIGSISVDAHAVSDDAVVNGGAEDTQIKDVDSPRLLLSFLAPYGERCTYRYFSPPVVDVLSAFV